MPLRHRSLESRQKEAEREKEKARKWLLEYPQNKEAERQLRYWNEQLYKLKEERSE